MFSVNEPGVIFIGVVEKNIAVVLTYERQVLIAKQYIEGQLNLPSKDDMLAEVERELEANR
jgi:hypothetical protein